MARPSRNTDRQLIEAGRRLLPHVGIAGLSLRSVAEEAGVNLGMFHYHFGSKDEFVRQVLQEIYEEFFEGLHAEFSRPDDEKNPIQRLRAMLEVLSAATFRNRELIASIVRDVLGGSEVAFAFVTANVPRHAGLVLETIREAQRKKLIRKGPTPEQILGLCVSTLGIPLVASVALERMQKSLKGFVPPKKIFPADAVDMRIDFLMRGLQP